MALNKAKVLKSAEKYVIQGKISHAIAEYQKLIKEDPTDLPLVNTLGDLYVRIGNVSEAVKCFTRLAESYDNGGFVVREGDLQGEFHYPAIHFVGASALVAYSFNPSGGPHQGSLRIRRLDLGWLQR